MPNKNPRRMEAENARKAERITELQQQLETQGQQLQQNQGRLTQVTGYLQQLAAHQAGKDQEDAAAVAVMTSPDPETDPAGFAAHQNGSRLDRIEQALMQVVGQLQTATAAGGAQAHHQARQADVTAFAAKQPGYQLAEDFLVKQLSSLPGANEQGARAAVSNWTPDQVWQAANGQGFKADAQPAPAIPAAPASRVDGVPAAAVAAGRSPTPAASEVDVNDMNQDEWDAFLSSAASDAGMTLDQMAQKQMEDDGHLHEVEGHASELEIEPSNP